MSEQTYLMNWTSHYLRPKTLHIILNYNVHNYEACDVQKVNTTFIPPTDIFYFYTTCPVSGNDYFPAGGPVKTSKLTFSGYDMSQTGRQTVTVTYQWDEDTVLTATYPLYVYGDTRWVQLWPYQHQQSGYDDATVKLTYMNPGVDFEVEGDAVAAEDGSFACACLDPDNLFGRIIGIRGNRKVRITYTVKNNYVGEAPINKVYVMNQQIAPNLGQPVTTEGIYTFDWFTYPGYGSNTYNALGVNKYGPFTHGAANRNQMIAADMKGEYGVNGYYFFWFHMYGADANENPGAVYGYPDLCGQEIKIQKIEVRI